MGGNSQPELEVWVPPASEQLSHHVVSCLFTFQGNSCVKNSALDTAFKSLLSKLVGIRNCGLFSFLSPVHTKVQNDVLSEK